MTQIEFQTGESVSGNIYGGVMSITNVSVCTWYENRRLIRFFIVLT